MRIHRPRHTQGWLCGGTPWDVELDDRRKGVSGCGNPFHLTASFELMLPRWMMILAIQRDKIYGQDRSSVSRRKTKTTVESAASNSSPIINLMGSDSPNTPSHFTAPSFESCRSRRPAEHLHTLKRIHTNWKVIQSAIPSQADVNRIEENSDEYWLHCFRR